MPVDLPPPPPAVVRALLQDPQPPLRLHQTDLVVDFVGELPVRTKLNELTRLLGKRHRASGTRRYPPTILELITLVERNPARPPGRSWYSVTALTIGYDAATNEVIVEYCLDYCGFAPSTSAPHPKRKMASYRAPDDRVVAKLNKKLRSLRNFVERPSSRK